MANILQHQNITQKPPYDPDKMQTLLVQLKDLDNKICGGDIDAVKVNIEILHNILVTDENLITELGKGDRKYLAYNLIISACEHKQPAILNYLLRETDILEYLPPTKENNLTNEEEDEQRIKALRYAMLADNIELVKLLYDYWRGDMHWSVSHNNDDKIKLLSRLETLLITARDECTDHLNHNMTMKIDVYCLIYFNEFQLAVYTRLNSTIPNAMDTTDNESIKTKAERAKEVVSHVLDVYKVYSKINKVRLPRETTVGEEEQILQQKLADKSTLYNKWFAYLWYKEYFMKIDFYVSLLVLDNLNFIKRHYTDAADICREVEYVLYHFIYRVYEDWRLYLPINREKVQMEVQGLLRGQETVVKFNMDPQEISRVPVIFLERRRLKKCLKNFISKIETQNKDKTHIEPYMKDFYSLLKMVYYMEEVSNKQINILVIDRALLVIGEIMNADDESDHLSSTTKALLQTLLSVDNIKLLHWIRNNYLGRAKCGELTKRIAIAKDNKQLYHQIQKDIEAILKCVNSVVEVYRPINDKSLLNNGLKLIKERMKEWPDDKVKKNITDDFSKEITDTLKNKHALLSILGKLEEAIESVGSGQLPLYFSNMKSTLDLIEKNNKKWDSLKHELLKQKIINNNNLTSYPSDDFIQLKLKKIIKYNKTDLKHKLEEIKDYSGYWQSVKNALTFFLKEMKIFKQIRKSVRPELLTCNKDNDGLSNNSLKDIRSLISKMEIVIQNLPSSTGLSTPHPINVHLLGIEELKKNLGAESRGGTFRENRDKLLTALINRINLLKDNLGRPDIKPLSQLLLKYRYDMNFRIVIEMLLIDINNIFVACGMRSLMNKTTNLLASVDLRNVLVHGNQILEVVGYVLDPYDFPTELLSKAKMVVEDAESIEALFELFKDNIAPEVIKTGDESAMNQDQRKFLELFRECERRDVYIKLVQLERPRT